MQSAAQVDGRLRRGHSPRLNGVKNEVWGVGGRGGMGTVTKGANSLAGATR